MTVGEWIKHDGGQMPVAGDVMVLCRFSDGFDEELEGLPPSPDEYWREDEDEHSGWCSSDNLHITEYKVFANA